MFKSLEYIECQKEDLSEIINTLAPIHKTMNDFTSYYISGKDRYTRLAVCNQLKRSQIKYIENILAQFGGKNKKTGLNRYGVQELKPATVTIEAVKNLAK